MRTVQGSTLLELLLVVSLLAMLSLGTWRTLTPTHAKQAATTFRKLALGHRLHALSGEPTAIRFDAQGQHFQFLRGAEGCAAPLQFTWSMPSGVAVTKSLTRDVQWLPDGSGRSCDGGGVYGGRIRFEGRREAWDVVLASTGRIRIEQAQP